MSSQSDALLTCLHDDLGEHLDHYQLRSSLAGKPIWPDATVRQAQCYALAGSLLKKFNEEENPSVAASSAALEKFLAANNRCKDFKLEPVDMRDEELINGVKQTLYEFFNPCGFPLFSSFDELFEAGSLGKGQNRLARASDIYTKLFDSPLSFTTETVHFLWTRIASRDPRWDFAVKAVTSEYAPQAVVGNKLSFVNKNATIARCISTEPTMNMWFQLGIGLYLTHGLKRKWNIDLATQPDINGEMACAGSMGNHLSTIDLESASDSISYGLCEAILPDNLLGYLRRFRSPAIELPNKEQVPLHMMSTMGNGFTFPLQTAIFSAVITAAYKHHGIRVVTYGPACERNFGVFGDDMICHTKATRTVVRLLGLLGFTVNSSKSFVEGPFRESCGNDWFNGQPCRGVYIKRLSSEQARAVAINALNRWSATCGVSLRETVGYLLSQIRHPKWVPPDESDDAGVHVPLDMAVGRKSLQHGIVGYTYDAALAKYLVVEDDAIVCGRGEVQRGYNPDGLWLCFLRGAVRGRKKNGVWGYTMSLRQRNVVYKTRRKVTPSWDALSPQRLTDWLTWPRWSDAVRNNLGYYG